MRPLCSACLLVSLVCMCACVSVVCVYLHVCMYFIYVRVRVFICARFVRLRVCKCIFVCESTTSTWGRACLRAIVRASV